MGFVHGAAPLVAELVRALGLEPEKVRSLALEFAPDSAVVSVVESYVTTDELPKLTELLRKFRLVLVEQDGEASEVPYDPGIWVAE